jgi:hypothetical protein
VGEQARTALNRESLATRPRAGQNHPEEPGGLALPPLGRRDLGGQEVLAMTRQRVVRWAVLAALPALVLSLCHASGQEKQNTAAQKRQSVINLAQIALAMHAYTDTYRQLPASANVDINVRGQFGNPLLTGEQLAKAKGKFQGKTLPLLSWRVAILPFIEEGALYKQFKLDEPWDSEHNKKLLEKMPKVYAAVTGKAKPGMTYYQVFVGKDAPFNGTIGPRFPASFTDGTSNTFLVAEAGEAVPWTKPQDIPFDGKAVPKLGGQFADGFHVAMADGTVRFVPRGADEKAIRAAITPSGGEAVEPPGEQVKLR